MKKSLSRILAGVMLVTSLPMVSYAESTSVLGSVGLETKLDNSIVVYENHFVDEASFNAVYNKDVDYGIHNINSQGGVKFSYKTDFTKALGSTNEKYYGTTQIRAFNGDSTTKSKGFWIDLDKVLEDYGPAHILSLSEQVWVQDMV